MTYPKTLLGDLNVPGYKEQLAQGLASDTHQDTLSSFPESGACQLPQC